MEINGLTSTTAAAANTPAQTAAAQQTAAVAAEEKNETEVAAVYEPSNEKPSSKKNWDVGKLSKMIQESNKQVESFKKLVEGLMSKQGNTALTASGKQKSLDDTVKDLITGLRDGSITVDEQTRLKAQNDISEDGYYGVKQTSERLLGFAKAYAGDDKNKLNQMKDAFLKGFGAAEDVFGGKSKLPSISYETYDAVMNGFDEWEKSITGK